MKKELFRNLLLETGRVSVGEIHGCTDEQISEIEKMAFVKLPACYKCFLREVGNGAGEFLAGTDIFYRHIASLRRQSEVLLVESCVEWKIPDDAFVFYMHQGYEFGIFYLGDNEDPAVYQYIEGDLYPKLTWDRFTHYFADMVKIFANQES